jgi:hypothetical protein
MRSFTPSPLRIRNSRLFFSSLILLKLFDRLEWDFIAAALRRLCLQSASIRLIHACISTPTFSILVNGEPTVAFFPSQRGIRQGCPLSHYFFVVAIDELSIRLQHDLHNSNLSGVTHGPGCPPIHSLLFADDLILYGEATMQEATNIRTILHEFCNRSGQVPNLQKSSIMFSKNVKSSTIARIKDIFPVPDLLPNTMHLGHPIIFNHNDRNKAYEFIINKFRAKLTTVKANKFNHAGRLTYIQSVLSSIHVYYMSNVLFSKNFIHRINAIIRRFWWAEDSGGQEYRKTTRRLQLLSVPGRHLPK